MGFELITFIVGFVLYLTLGMAAWQLLLEAPFNIRTRRTRLGIITAVLCLAVGLAWFMLLGGMMIQEGYYVMPTAAQRAVLNRLGIVMYVGLAVTGLGFLAQLSNRYFHGTAKPEEIKRLFVVGLAILAVGIFGYSAAYPPLAIP